MTNPGLYLHFPYCQAKCFYCDFNSHVETRPNVRRYLTALLLEAEHVGVRRPHTVFFGGGTPSLIPPDDLSWFLENLQRTTGYRDSSSEFTIEANPESISTEFLDACIHQGVDRISLGVQALDSATLEFFARIHTVKRATQAMELLAASSLRSWNVDLIMGAPCQPEHVWKRGVGDVLSFRPPHLSLYDLIYEPGTTLSSLRSRGKIEPRSSDDQARLYLWNQRTLRRFAYEPYEVSAFAQADHRCRHNLIYWTNGPYVGLGAGAASFGGGWRTKNVDDPRLYLDRVEKLGRGTCFAERLAPRTRLIETLMMRLRLREPILLAQVATHADVVDLSWLEPTLARLRQQSLIVPQEDVLLLTARGRRLADHVIEQLCHADTSR